ncbi:HBR031Cp [Eremothecium sinecaudum]|uniref:HBR031Cp n=1 Tax=Eremothecium sinecaudum TaxID=45286 RepID=A0A120K124_9SACH|nr:HBR031Cp [Eremothecium sinecaudum]AMD18932.1 HBR031Cp [Eremothecium sinecaudum]
MKTYNVTYVEIINNDNATTKCQWYGGDESQTRYGAISNRAQKDISKDTFHRLVYDVIIPKVVHRKGNKITKTTVSLVDGYDGYYTTDDDGDILVSFASVETPKILPLRVLTQLKGMVSVDDESLRNNITAIVTDFHKELLSYHDSTMYEATDQDLQEIINVMNDNIDKFLRRQERITLLVDQTSQLNQNSFNFQRKAIKIKRNMWWRSFKFWAVCVLAAMSFLFILWVMLHS